MMQIERLQDPLLDHSQFACTKKSRTASGTSKCDIVIAFYLKK